MGAPSKAFLVASLSVAPFAAHAIKLPVPIEGVNLNFGVNIQTHALFNENGTPDGTGWSTDVFMRRTRLTFNGDVSKYFWFFIQVDNTNFGKFGNFTGRMIVQDAVFAWAPTGSTGTDVLLIEAGILRVPSSRGTITNVNNNFTIDGHPDLIRGFNANTFNANRSLALEVRGWVVQKKIGFRGGVFEGVRPFNAADAGLNPHSAPLLAGIVNFNIFGSQEGGFSYESIYFSKETLLSISLAGGYQSRSVRVPKGVADFQTAASTAFLEYPFSEDTEVIASLIGYRHAMGTGSKDTGWGWGADLAYRWKWVRPYASIEWFTSEDCPTDPAQLSGAALTTCRSTAGAHSADSRNFRTGLDFYINKTLNHVMIEFAVNHGLSSWGPQSITAATAGYVPASLDPVPPSTARRPINTLLSSPAQRSVLLQWAVVF